MTQPAAQIPWSDFTTYSMKSISVLCSLHSCNSLCERVNPWGRLFRASKRLPDTQSSEAKLPTFTTPCIRSTRHAVRTLPTGSSPNNLPASEKASRNPIRQISDSGHVVSLWPPITTAAAHRGTLVSVTCAVRPLHRDHYCRRCTLIASRRAVHLLYARCVAIEAHTIQHP